MDDFIVIEQFPTLIAPSQENMSWEDLAYRLRSNKHVLEKLLLKHGAILFRNFPVTSAELFSDFIETLNFGEFVNYIGGDSPRDKVEKKVYTSTEAPPNFHISLHQELSYVKKFPRHIYFYCDIAPAEGGETIIADARKVYASLDPDVINRFHAQGLTYISHYFHNSKIMQFVNKIQRSHKSWPEVFETSNPLEVEKLCAENEFEWQWLRNNWLEIKQTRPALLDHPITQETVWFNQAHLYDFNVKHLGLKNYVASKIFYFRKHTRLHEITFANGSRIPKDDLYHVMDVLNENTVAFPWQKKDVMVLDNVLAMHGRAPFVGPRRILTALTK